mmetsp:Transcript_21844/g.45762  ORF Transcript_21844/g.45762 Transcript_21844/m.45762 type:complete len:303 (+) Transcript_21844:224-1132(+)
MTSILQINPNLTPPLSHTVHSIILRKNDKLFTSLHRRQSITLQQSSQFPIAIPHHRSHGSILKRPNSHDTLRLLRKRNRPPLSSATRLLHRRTRRFRRLLPLTRHRELQRPRHRLLLELRLVVIVVHFHDGGCQRIHSLGEGAQTAEAVVSSFVGSFDAAEAGVLAEFVAVSAAEEEVGNFGCRRRGLESIGLELSQKVLNGIRFGYCLILRLRYGRVHSLFDVDGIPIVGLSDDRYSLLPSRLEFVHRNPREYRLRLPRQHLGSHPQRPPGNNVRDLHASILFANFATRHGMQIDTRSVEQ